MRLFPCELEIAPNEGFTPQKDIFGRKSFGEQLTRIVSKIETPSVLLLDAPWGTGKTTFIKMWRGELLNVDISSIYLDAFANDYQQDAFLAVASQIVADAEMINPRRIKAINTFTKKAVQVAKVLGRASLRLGVRAATAGLVEGEGLEKAGAEIVKAAGEETANVADEVLKARLESHDSDRKVFENFKSALAELAIAFSPPVSEGKEDSKTPSNKDGGSFPLVFIIDELDRCRPSFALELLEKIKHFFSVPNVIFVLVSSLSQLESAVRFAYGDIDARTYLEKFYHLRVLFPVGRPGRADMAVETYLRHLQCNQNEADIISRFCQIHPLSLRTLERIVAYSKIVGVSMPKGSFWLPQIVSVLCILKVIRPELYADARRGNLTFAQVNDLLRFDDWRDLNDPEKRLLTGINTENWWLLALGEDFDQEIKERLEKVLWQSNMNPPRIISYFCDLIDGFAF